MVVGPNEFMKSWQERQHGRESLHAGHSTTAPQHHNTVTDPHTTACRHRWQPAPPPRIRSLGHRWAPGVEEELAEALTLRYVGAAAALRPGPATHFEGAAATGARSDAVLP